MLILAMLTSTLAMQSIMSCLPPKDCVPNFFAGAGRQDRKHLRRQRATGANEANRWTVTQAGVPKPDDRFDAETVLAQAEMMALCKEANIQLNQTVEQECMERAKKIGAAIGVGGAGFEGGNILGHKLAVASGACYLDKTNHLQAVKGAGLKGTLLKGVCGTLLPAGLGGVGFIAAYEGMRRKQARKDQQSLIEMLQKIREAEGAKVTDADLAGLAACNERLRATLNLEEIKGEDFSTEVSLYERAYSTEGILNCDDKMFFKTMPLQKIGLITHGIYHSPLVPIHEGLMSLMTYGTTHGWSHATLSMLGTMFASPLIPGAGFPLAYFFYSLVQSVTPKLFEDAHIAKMHLERVGEGNCNGVRATDFFTYRGKVHTNWETLNNPIFHKDYPLCWRHLFKGGLGCRQKFVMNGPTYLDETVIRKEMPVALDKATQRGNPGSRQRREYNANVAEIAEGKAYNAKMLRQCKLTNDQVDQIADFLGKAATAVTVCDIADYRAAQLSGSAEGVEVLTKLQSAIENMAEANYVESWSYERLQEDFGLHFPTVVSREEETIPAMLENFQMGTQQGKLQAGCFIWALATLGDVGTEVTTDLLNDSLFWGAPRKTNMWVGSQVYYNNKLHTVVSKHENAAHDGIDIELRTTNLDTLQEETVALTLDAERDLAHAALHGGVHHGIAGGVLGGGVAVIASGPAAPIAAGALVGGAVMGTHHDHHARATNADQVGELKIADTYTFHNQAANLAWEIQYKPLTASLEHLKEIQRAAADQAAWVAGVEQEIQRAGEVHAAAAAAAARVDTFEVIPEEEDWSLFDNYVHQE